MQGSLPLSIIITTWNTRDLVCETLRSIRANPPSCFYEVLVVDNASGDGTAEAIAKEFPDVRVIRNTVNQGFAKGNNQAAGAARGDVLLLLGSDTAVQRGTIQTMYDHLCRRDDVGAVSCKLLSPDGSLQRSCRRFPTLADAVLTYLSLHRFARRYTMQDFDYERTQEVEQPAATCFMVRSAVVAGKIFDERYTILYNDVDLCRRLRGKGCKILYVAEASVIHHGSQSTRRATPELRLEMYRNILVYYAQTYGIIALIVLLPILTVRLAIVNRGKRLAGLLAGGYLRG